MDTLTFQDFITNVPLQIALTLTIALVLQLFIKHSIGRLVARIVRGDKHASKQEERQREETLSTVFERVALVVLWVAVIVVILYQLHVNVAALLAGAGVLGVVIGLGAQAAIKDFLAGLFILIENQYRVGDVVTLDSGNTDISGVVESISLRTTRLRDLDGNIHIVQNGSAGVVTNLSFNFANVNLDVGIAYDADIEKVRDVINQIGIEQAGEDEWKKQIIEPIEFLRVDSFADSAVMLKAIGKVQPGTQWDVAGDYRLRLKKAFDKHHITLPYPQIVVHQPQTKR